MTLIHQHVNAEGRGPSVALWKNFPVDRVFNIPDFATGFGIQNDFTSYLAWSEVGADTLMYGNDGSYTFRTDTGTTLKQLAFSATATASGQDGVIRHTSGGTDNDEMYTQWCQMIGSPFHFSTANKKEMIFECRFRTSTITDNQQAFFIGLAEPGLCATNTMVSNTGALAAKDLVGFNRLQADGDAVIWGYNIDSGTYQTVKSGIHVPVADTWYKYGFRYDPTAEKITAYIDGVAQADVITTAMLQATTVFPDAQGMTPSIFLKDGTGGAYTFDTDWIRIGQLS